MNLITARKILPVAAYMLVLAAVSLHLYIKPLSDIDMLGYMGNALLEDETDPVRIHQKIYDEVATQLLITRQQFSGQEQEPGAPGSQNASRRDRATNANHFAEFLPFCAVRPVYNQLLWLLGKSSMSLIRASVLVSVVSYFLLGCLVFGWAERYVGSAKAALCAILLMISPPITRIGRFTGADCISTLFALFSIYLIWEKGLLAPSVAVLLFSTYIRTDNVALAIPVILVGLWRRSLPDWQAAVLLPMVALGSVLLINHFAGDYGISMLYYRNFIGTPIATAEMSATFSVSDYVAAFRSGISDALRGFLIPFLVAGAAGFLRTIPRMRMLGMVALAGCSLAGNRAFAVLSLCDLHYSGSRSLC